MCVICYVTDCCRCFVCSGAGVLALAPTGRRNQNFWWQYIQPNLWTIMILFRSPHHPTCPDLSWAHILQRGGKLLIKGRNWAWAVQTVWSGIRYRKFTAYYIHACPQTCWDKRAFSCWEARARWTDADALHVVGAAQWNQHCQGCPPSNNTKYSRECHIIPSSLLVFPAGAEGVGAAITLELGWVQADWIWRDVVK